jgi:hypothetical protein
MVARVSAVSLTPKFGACRPGFERQPNVGNKACRKRRYSGGNRPHTDSNQESPVVTIGAMRVHFRHAVSPKNRLEVDTANAAKLDRSCGLMMEVRHWLTGKL